MDPRYESIYGVWTTDANCPHWRTFGALLFSTRHQRTLLNRPWSSFASLLQPNTVFEIEFSPSSSQYLGSPYSVLRAMYPLSLFTLHPSIYLLSHFQFLSQSLKYSVSLQTTRHVSRQFILPDYLPLCPAINITTDSVYHRSTSKCIAILVVLTTILPPLIAPSGFGTTSFQGWQLPTSEDKPFEKR